MSGSKKPIRVLYIEDNPGHARLLMKRLEREGEFHVDWINDSIEDINIARRRYNKYDVVISDFNLPGKSGIEIIGEIKFLEGSPPTIMLTAEGSEETAVEALHAGASDYLVKDVGSHYLTLIPTVICNVISKRKTEEDKKKADEEIQRLNALLKAEQEASISGILSVDTDGKILNYNKRFLEVWDIPKSVAEKGEDDKLLSHVEGSVKNWDAFIKLVKDIYRNPEEERVGDIIEMTSGKVLSRNTRPIRLETGEIIGRLWDFEDITERRKHEELIRQMAYHDDLTGLPNRRTFFDRLSMALADAKRNNYLLAVLFMDLNRFKEINDALGHDIGDKVLQTAAQGMKLYLRESDTLARMGGDEFLVLLPKITKMEDAQLVAEKILKEFQEPKSIDGHEISIGLSIGTGFYPRDGEDAESLIKKADDAMYAKKLSGRK